MFKRILTLALALCMLLSCVSAFAAAYDYIPDIWITSDAVAYQGIYYMENADGTVGFEWAQDGGYSYTLDFYDQNSQWYGNIATSDCYYITRETDLSYGLNTVWLSVYDRAGNCLGQNYVLFGVGDFDSYADQPIEISTALGSSIAAFTRNYPWSGVLVNAGWEADCLSDVSIDYNSASTICGVGMGMYWDDAWYAWSPYNVQKTADNCFTIRISNGYGTFTCYCAFDANNCVCEIRAYMG